MVLRIAKAVRNFVFGVHRKSKVFHRAQELAYWDRMKGRKKHINSGTFYFNFAGEQFKVTRSNFETHKFDRDVLQADITVEVNRGNSKLEQTTNINIVPKSKVVELYDVAVLKDAFRKPPVSQRGRNLLRAVIEEAIAIGKEQFGNQEFKIRLSPSTDDLRSLYIKFGFREYDLRSHDMEKVINPV
jgi:hypothetical protein